MQQKINIRKGDTVKVIAGDSKGQQGKVLVVNRDKYTAIVEGVNMVSKHTRPNSKSPQGGIQKKEAPIHISNMQIVDGKGNATRVGRMLDEKTNKLIRVSKKTGEVIK
jgi:large subunit ribosomal protein L24